MKASIDELRRVAADMLRQGGDEMGAAVLVEGAEWAAKALEHRNTILSNLETRAEERVCPGCLVMGRLGVHDRDCRLAATLHALDPEWSLHEVNSCHEAALRWYERPKRTSDAVDALRYGLGNMRVEVNPLVPPGTAYMFWPRSYMNPLVVTRVDMPDAARGEWPDRPQTDESVAPPDEDDVP